MKTAMRPVNMLAWFNYTDTPRPLRFSLDGKEYKVEQIISIKDEKLAGNHIKVYSCQSEINGQLKRYDLKFELQTCKWYLWKM